MRPLSEGITDELRSYATVRQLEFLDAVLKHGTAGAAAEALGIDPSTISVSLGRLRAKAAAKGWAPEHNMTHTAAPGFRVKGTSTYYDKDGQQAGQWVKTTEDAAQREAIFRAWVDDLARNVAPAKPVAAPQSVANDLLAIYPWGDPHIGMYAWWQEAGEDFDLTIAESMTQEAVDRLVASAPPARVGLLLNLGDLLHANDQTNLTSSGHQLDVDGRWAKVLQVALNTMVYAVQRLLEKHNTVVVRCNKGNHDKESSFAVALMLSCFFRNEPRVQIDLTPGFFWYYRFGKVLIGTTHGDTAKGKDLMGVMAADRPAEWGLSKHRYWYCGHVHHRDLKEYPGGVVEYFRTLAARDAWHQGMGYRAGRDMCLIVHHVDHGEIERHRVDVGMLPSAPVTHLAPRPM